MPRGVGLGLLEHVGSGVVTRRIAALPLWYRPFGFVPRTKRFDHVVYYDGNAVCGFSWSQLDAVVSDVRRCPKCVEWLRARGSDTPGMAATFADVYEAKR